MQPGATGEPWPWVSKGRPGARDDPAEQPKGQGGRGLRSPGPGAGVGPGLKAAGQWWGSVSCQVWAVFQGSEALRA